MNEPFCMLSNPIQNVLGNISPPEYAYLTWFICCNALGRCIIITLWIVTNSQIYIADMGQFGFCNLLVLSI
jgi:hypothetical protein